MSEYVQRTPPVFAVLTLGIVSQVSQVLLLRELLMVFHGNELSIGLILAAWMLWTGAGSRLGAVVAARFNNISALVISSATGLLLVLPATILLARGLRFFFNLPPGAHLSLWDVTISCFLLMAPPCLLLGGQFVFLAGVWRKRNRSGDTSGAGKTYMVEAAGNMAGGLLFTFFLVHFLNAFQTAFLAGLLMIAAGCSIARINGLNGVLNNPTAGIPVSFTGRKRVGNKATNGFRCRGLISIRKVLRDVFRKVFRKECKLFKYKGKFKPGLLVLFFMPVLVIASFPVMDLLDEWAWRMQWHHFAPGYELVEVRQSKHGMISVVRHEDQYSFYQSGHLVFSTAGPRTVSPGMEEQEAVEFAHLAMVQHPQPERVLLIGGGLRGLLREIVQHPVESIDYIELDEVLTKAARHYVPAATLNALNDPAVNLIHGDGRLFVKTARQSYDIIIIDIPDPATAVLNRYYTREFFAEAAGLLAPGGVLVTGAVSTPDLRGTAVANRNTTIYHTLSAVFNRVLTAGDHFLMYFAANEPGRISLEPAVLKERYMNRDIRTEGFSPYHYRAILEEGQLRRVNQIVRNHGRSSKAHLKGPDALPLFPPLPDTQDNMDAGMPPVQEDFFVNTDFRPIGYFYSLMFWDEVTRPAADNTLRWLLHLQWWWILPFCVVPLLIVCILRAVYRAGVKRTRQSGPEASGSGPHKGFAILFTVFTTGLSTMALQIALLFSFQSIYGFVYETVGFIIALFMCGLSTGAFFTNNYLFNRGRNMDMDMNMDMDTNMDKDTNMDMDKDTNMDMDMDMNTNLNTNMNINMKMNKCNIVEGETDEGSIYEREKSSVISAIYFLLAGLCPDNKAGMYALAAMQLIIAVLAAIIAVSLPLIATIINPSVIFFLFSLLTFSAGLINGIDFPLSVACYMALHKHPEKTAGTVYGVELCGACAGSALASVVVVPVMGIVAACALAAIANFTAFVVLLLSRGEQG